VDTCEPETEWRRSFAEYFEPFTGEPPGSSEQSWTAAVVLDWLAADGITKIDTEAA
jgi:hypothetical protein